MIVYINARFLTQPITGVQRFAIELSKELYKRDDIQLEFVAPSNVLHQDLIAELNVKIIGNRVGHLWEQIDLPLYLKKKGSPSLLNLCNTAPLLYSNKIVTVHDIAFEVFPETYSRSFLLFYKFLIPRVIKNSKHVITVSNFSKSEIIKYYNTDKNKISVIYNAAGNIFHNKPAADKQVPYFVAVSSLNFRKNLPLVLKAFNELSKVDTSVCLYIVGALDTVAFTALDLTEYKSNPRIIFTGRVSDHNLVSSYSNAIGFVYPSLYEGFGIPPLEAQKCGAPVILSDRSCFPEIFGSSVLYCDAEDVTDLYEKMLRVMNDAALRGRLIVLGYENCKNYSWVNSADKLIKVLNNFVK